MRSLRKHWPLYKEDFMSKKIKSLGVIAIIVLLLCSTVILAIKVFNAEDQMVGYSSNFGEEETDYITNVYLLEMELDELLTDFTDNPSSYLDIIRVALDIQLETPPSSLEKAHGDYSKGLQDLISSVMEYPSEESLRSLDRFFDAREIYYEELLIKMK